MVCMLYVVWMLYVLYKQIVSHDFDEVPYEHPVQSFGLLGSKIRESQELHEICLWCFMQ